MAGISRRGMLKIGGLAVGTAAFGKAVAPLAAWTGEQSLEEFFRRHYLELNEEQVSEILARIEQKTLDEYGVEVSVEDDLPIEGVKFGYALNVSVCVGCRRCMEACHIENNHDRASYNSNIRVLEMNQGSLSLENSSSTYDHTVPAEGKFYLPVQCHQCDNPPCTRVCPVGATWKDPDGVVVIDYDWCIGCRYCQAACPYHARRFNWSKPEIAAEEINPDQGFLSNRIRSQGVMEKCHFCLHRTRRGRLPACLEVCPTGARVFGDLNDPESDIRWVLENRRVFILKEELGTVPSFYYFFVD